MARHMTVTDWQTVELDLAGRIDEWLTASSEEHPTPYVGPNVTALMARVAVSVLMAIADTEQFLLEEHLLRD